MELNPLLVIQVPVIVPLIPPEVRFPVILPEVSSVEMTREALEPGENV
jgi:hypothetical protein